MKKELNLYFNKNLIITFIIFLILFFISSYCYNKNEIQQQQQQQLFINSDNNKDRNYNNIRSDKIIAHTNKFIEIGNSKNVYEESRSIAREYIRDYLIEGGIPKDNIIWNHFEWSERHAEGKNITTTTWTGINIIIWINTTAIPTESIEYKPVRIIGSNYDTKYWGLNKTAGAHDSLSGTGLVIEEALELFKFQESESKRTGKANDTPYMFILFDQEKPGALGSRSFVANSKISKMASQSQIAYFLNIDAIGMSKQRTIIQTFPYEHKHQTYFTPRWLVNSMVQSAYSINPIDGITVGSSNIGISIMYQAHRYHLNSVPYLGDEGPFTWAGVDSILLTDVDFFYCDQNHDDSCNPHYGQLSDQPFNLDQDILKETADIVYTFLLNTRTPSSIPRKDFKNYTNSPVLNLLLSTFDKFLNLFFSGNNQYLFIGPICLGYFQLLLITLFLLLFIYFTTFKNYRDLVLQYEKCKYQKRKRIYRLKKHEQTNNDESTSEQEYYNKNIDSEDNGTESSSSGSSTPTNNINNNNSNSNSNNSSSSSYSYTTSFFDSIRGHRVLFLHILILAIASFIDTVYAFEMVCLGFLSLSTFHIYKYNINLLTGFISGAFCTNFIYKDITQIFTFSKKGNGSQELFLNVLLGVYIVHSILIVIYGYDYGKKKEELKLNKFDGKDN